MTWLSSALGEVAIGKVIFPFPPHHWDVKWHTLPFPIPPIMQVLHTCFAADMGSKCFILVPWVDSKVSVISPLHKIRDFRLMVWKNHISRDVLTKPVRMVLTLQIHCNANLNLKREKE